MPKSLSDIANDNFFEDIKKQILKVDPVFFASEYLTIDGNPLELEKGSGWKYMADIYRYVGINALTKAGKPVICLKGRQLGFSTMAAALELYFCTSDLFGTSSERPPIKVLHCFPSLVLVQKFSKDRLSVMMRNARDEYVAKHSLSYNEETGKKRIDVPDDTLTEKQFKNENKLWIDSNANDAQRLQSMTLDVIFYDEVQRMNQDDIGNSKRTLTASKYGPRGKGVQLYFGTPLMRGSTFHKMWEASDKRFFHLGCCDCKEYFKLYELGSDSWESIWLYGNTIRCPKCGKEQDRIKAIDAGMWIASQPTLNGKEPPNIGFHVNQLLIPYFTKETILAPSYIHLPTLIASCVE